MDKEIYAMIENFEKKTGTRMSDWKKIIEKSGLTKHGEIVNLLKSVHGLTHGYASMVVHVVKDSSSASVEDKDQLIINQYKGKEILKPIYDKLIEIFTGFGSDVVISPKLSYVSIRKNSQFAMIKPSSKTRIDVGLKLKGKEATTRLKSSNAVQTNCTHVLSVEKPSDIDKTLIGWLKEAYEANK